MKNTGIVRRFDELGRVTIPIELRRTMDLKDRAPVEIMTDEDTIIPGKYEPKNKECVFCGSENDLIEVNGKHQCRTCLYQAMTKHQAGDVL